MNNHEKNKNESVFSKHFLNAFALIFVTVVSALILNYFKIDKDGKPIEKKQEEKVSTANTFNKIKAERPMIKMESNSERKIIE